MVISTYTAHNVNDTLRQTNLLHYLTH